MMFTIREVVHRKWVITMSKNYYDGNGNLITFDDTDFSKYLTTSKNMLDDTRISRPPVGTTAFSIVKMDADYFIDVSGFTYLGSNKATHTINCYNESKESLGSIEGSGLGVVKPVQLPANTAFVNVWWYGRDNASDTASVQPTGSVTLYGTMVKNDVDTTVMPNKMVNGSMVYGDTYKFTLPGSDDEFTRWMKCNSIRAINQTTHRIRVGNWNIYGAQRETGSLNGNWAYVSKVLAEYGLDICGFEEVKYQNGDNLKDYLVYKRPYQFQYGNTNVPDGSTWSPMSNRAMVSRYNVLESQEIATQVDSGTYNNRSFLYTKIALPRYMDAMGGLQYLAFYVIHPTVTTSENQTLEWQVLIDHMQTNKCAFKIVVSDTNDWFYDENGYPVHWKMLEDAGLTPVNDGSSKTQTDANTLNAANDQSYDHNSFDNIFVSSNINVKQWNIVSVWGMELLPIGRAISDHDLIYADLEFDYSDLIVPMRPMTDYIAVIQTLTHCTSSYVPPYDNPINMAKWSMTQNFTATITADTGYTLSSVVVKVGGSDKTSQYYSNGVVSVPSSAMQAGDILIVATAE